MMDNLKKSSSTLSRQMLKLNCPNLVLAFCISVRIAITIAIQLSHRNSVNKRYINQTDIVASYYVMHCAIWRNTDA